MSDTHINAYFQDVEDKLQVVLAAQAEHEAALDRLEQKKKEVNWVDPEDEQVNKPEKSEDIDDKKGLFKKNR